MFSVTKSKIVLLALFHLIGGATLAPASEVKTEAPAKEGVNAAPVKSQKSTTDTEKPYKNEEQVCLALYQKFVPSLQELWKKRGPELKPENTDGYALIEDSPSDYCKDESTRKELVRLLSMILNTHSGKIGVILPLAKHNFLRHVIAGFEARLKSAHLDPKKILVIIDNQNRDERTHQAVASMIFEHKVSAIIGGTEPNDAAVLRYWAPRIMIPTFLMIEPQTSSPMPFVYYSHPTQKSLAKAAVDANVRFGHKRVSILVPQDQHSDRFISAYAAHAKIEGVSIIHQMPYDAKRFPSMEAAARKIFRLDTADRREDLKKLYETAKKHAQDTGEAFNPKMVALQPDVQQDAIMIPDNFKIVRHFAKILGYLGVRKMPLFGHFEWRSKGLITPWDGFLSGSYFVDFQGLYTTMPEAIRIPTLESPFFIPSDTIEQADFSLLAWRTMETPLTLSRKRHEMRRKMDRLIPRKIDDQNTQAFDQENTIVWHPSLFTVSGKAAGPGTLTILNQ